MSGHARQGWAVPPRDPLKARIWASRWAGLAGKDLLQGAEASLSGVGGLDSLERNLPLETLAQSLASCLPGCPDSTQMQMQRLVPASLTSDG